MAQQKAIPVTGGMGEWMSTRMANAKSHQGGTK